MPDPVESFLDAATRSFGDNAELQIVTRRELEEAIHHAPETGDSLETMRDRFDALDARPSRLSSWVFAAMAAASLALLAWTSWSFYEKRHEMEWFENLGDFMLSDIPGEKLTRGLSASEKILLLGNPTASPEGNRMKALWKSDPENPAYFAEYARTWVAKEKSMPPELWEEARRLDPDNGYYHFLAAVAAAEKSVGEVLRTRKKGEPLRPREYNILNASKWNQALDHLHAAAAAPDFKSYEKELRKSRSELLPLPDDILSLAPKTDYLFGNKVAEIRSFTLHRVVSAKALECLKQGDREGLLKLHAAWDSLLLRLLECEPPSPIQTLLIRSSVGASSENFLAAADGLDMPDFAAKIRARKELLADEHSPLKQAMGNDEAKDHARLHGGLLQEYAFLLEPPKEEEMRPIRLGEYALMDRAAAIGAWIILAVMTVCVTCYRFRAPGLAKRISSRLSYLVTGRDLLHMIAAGVILPYLFWLATTHFTPLGGREWNFHAHGGLIVAGQLLAVVLLMLLIPLILARRRLSQRASRLGLRGGSSVFGWLSVAACILSIPLFYTAQAVMVPERLIDSGDILNASSFIDLDPDQAGVPGSIWLWTAIGLLASATIYGLVSILRSLFTRRQHLLRRAILSRMLVPAYLAGTLLFAMSMPIHHVVERFWFARDMARNPISENFGIPTSEVRLLQLDQEKLRQAMEQGR
jgi:hypothetical protein